MSDVYAIFGTLLALGIAFPGLIFTWWLLFPGPVARAETRLTRTPGRAFLFGLLLILVTTSLVLMLANLPLPGANMFSAGLILATLAVAAVGTAGLVNQMAWRLRDRSRARLSPAGSFLGAVVTLELAAAFPILGWFLFIPFCLIFCLGAAGLSLISRGPRRQTMVADEPLIVTPAAGGRDVA